MSTGGGGHDFVIEDEAGSACEEEVCGKIEPKEWTMRKVLLLVNDNCLPRDLIVLEPVMLGRVTLMLYVICIHPHNFTSIILLSLGSST